LSQPAPAAAATAVGLSVDGPTLLDTDDLPTSKEQTAVSRPAKVEATPAIPPAVDHRVGPEVVEETPAPTEKSPANGRPVPQSQLFSAPPTVEHLIETALISKEPESWRERLSIPLATAVLLLIAAAVGLILWRPFGRPSRVGVVELDAGEAAALT